MSYRPYRIEVSGVLKTEGPLHIGTGQDLSLETDSPVLRTEGEPYIPGSSLRGVLRSHLEAEASLLGCKAREIESLFGKVESGHRVNKSAVGRLTVSDAHRVPTAPSVSEIRDHVRIDRRSGSAARGAKFDSEVLLEGATFEFHASYEGDSEKDRELVLLHEAVKRLESGELRIGAKSGWGYGKVWLQEPTYRVFKRDSDQGIADYLAHRLGMRVGTTTRPWGGLDGAKPISESGPASSVAVFSIVLRFEGPVLVKAPIPPSQSAAAGDESLPQTYAAAGLHQADHVFVSTGQNGRYYLPGSSLRGVLRSQAARISQSRRNQVEDLLFGVVKKRQAACHKGQIEVEDSVLLSGDPIYLDHVAIDRITAAAADGKKFSTCGLISPTFRTSVRVHYQPGQEAILALWGFLLRDLVEGRLWAGSGTTRGYGYIRRADIESVSLNLVELSCPRIPADLLEMAHKGSGRVILTINSRLEFADLNWLWEHVQEFWKESA